MTTGTCTPKPETYEYWQWSGENEKDAPGWAQLRGPYITAIFVRGTPCHALFFNKQLNGRQKSMKHGDCLLLTMPKNSVEILSPAEFHKRFEVVT